MEKPNFLSTIALPRNLLSLKTALPKANYKKRVPKVCKNMDAIMEANESKKSKHSMKSAKSTKSTKDDKANLKPPKNPSRPPKP